MKDVAQIIQGYKPEQQKPDYSEQEQAQAIRAADYIFRTLGDIFPNGFKRAFANPEAVARAKTQWAKAILDGSVLDRSMINRGIESARSQEFDAFPTIGRFISWCMHDPSDDSFQRFIDRAGYKSYAERYTAQKIGFKCRTQISEAEARKLWNETISKVRRQIAKGEIVEPSEDRMISSPEEMKKTETREQINQRMDRQIDEMLAKGQKAAIRGALKKRMMERFGDEA